MKTKRIKSFSELVAYWREDLRVHRRLIEPGFHAMAVYRFGVWVDGLDIAVLRYGLRKIYFALNASIELAYGVRIQYTTPIGRRLHLAHAGSGIIIGVNCTIGDDCVLRQNVTLGAVNSHKPEMPTLGDRVEVGAGAVVIGPITIGDDAAIGPNVVVRQDVPAGSAVMPSEPVVTVRSRFRRRAAAPVEAQPLGEPVGPDARNGGKTAGELPDLLSLPAGSPDGAVRSRGKGHLPWH